MPKRQVSWPGCRSAGRRDGPHDAPARGTDYGDDAIFPNLLEIPTDYAHANSAGHNDQRATLRICKSGRAISVVSVMPAFQSRPAAW